MNGSSLKKIVPANTKNTYLYTNYICFSIVLHFCCGKKTLRLTSSKIMFWWHLLNNESSTPESLTKLELIVKIRSIQGEGVLVMLVCWLISTLYQGCIGSFFMVRRGGGGRRAELKCRSTWFASDEKLKKKH